MKKFFSFIVIAIAISAILYPFISKKKSEKQAKYVFFMIGDGMGLAQSMLAQDYLAALSKDTCSPHLDFLKMPINGYASTYSNNSLVTCSSASGTALSTGHKTNNGMLGLAPDSVTKLYSITKSLHENDYLIGILSNVSIDHATPASFYAHAPSRTNYDLIASQLSSTGYEYFAGGGMLGMKYDSTLLDSVKDDGYTVSNEIDIINNHKLSDGKLYAFSNILGKSMDIPYRIDMPDHKMNLSYFVKKGIDMFEETGKNFFMMIEGGKIDWAGHSNDAATIIHEVIDLDEAYKEVYDFYLRHPDETLIVMTADHETGGLALGRDETGYSIMPELVSNQKISDYEFNALIDDCLANKIHSLEQIYKLIKEYYGFNNGNEQLNLNQQDSIRINKLYQIKTHKNNKVKYSSKETFASLCLDFISKKAGIGWTTHAHTGIAVPVRAIGCGAENFNGFYDNTDIPKKILKLTKVEL